MFAYFLITIFLLIVSNIATYIFYNQIKSRHKSSERANTIFRSALPHITNNFYFKDLQKRHEYVKLIYENNAYESLEKFLNNFSETNEILRFIKGNRVNNSQVHFEQKLISIDKEVTIKASIYLIIEKQQLVGIAAIFHNISEYENYLQLMRQKLKKATHDHHNLSDVIRLSPYTLWKETKQGVFPLNSQGELIKKELEKYNAFKGQLYTPTRKTINYVQLINIDNEVKLFQINKVYADSMYMCFAHDISATHIVERKLQGYQKMIPTFMDSLPIPSILIDENYRVKLCNNALIQLLKSNNTLLTIDNYWQLLKIIDAKFQFKDSLSSIQHAQEELIFGHTEEKNIFIQYSMKNKTIPRLKFIITKIDYFGFIINIISDSTTQNIKKNKE